MDVSCRPPLLEPEEAMALQPAVKCAAIERTCLLTTAFASLD